MNTHIYKYTRITTAFISV